MAWLLDVEKFLKISLFVFDATHERGRHTERQTDTAWQHRPRLCIASCGKCRTMRCKSCKFWFIRGFYVYISIRNILKENLQPKLKVASVWPKSTAVITGVIFTYPGRARPVFRLHRGLVHFGLVYAIYSLRITTLDTSLKLTASTV